MGLFLSRGISHFFRLFVAPRERGLEPDRGPLLAFDPLATRDGDGRSLVKAEAAGGGGRSRRRRGPKPPEAGAEAAGGGGRSRRRRGPKARLYGHRRESAAEVGGPIRHRSLFNMPAFPRRVRARMDFPPFLILS